MNDYWKEKTCELCDFRCGIRCQRLPPPNNDGYVVIFIKEHNFYFPACAEYKEND